ncbi:MAG: DNA polymerase III subunit beta [Candidatus Doudnabacteria bacterium RIFCSPLOWO2_01_FULL_44_21]|uniref:Beta sliding clamp n=1 Tax=Candidatus Doudnabacteria bacterium RIFCSPLOWO2_01_FULL_44_21 TaxID=1817841 RepID=A0A1F5PXA6_9BACT|nr:MAG: DNA polymerase III subunit beta [Candidatus Doudnabacteria bacterium RIFCSPHIGHO2_02_FULL_43_13b]OGE94543.1 MAG: DNA polymerase III subunit beta [Candidatus Doudnabacteria bacterium RIFCSPLOWO2_01_FULL_44_21]
MKLIVTKENLKKGLFAVSRVVGSGNPLQVLNNILIKTDQGRVKFSATNLEIGVNTWVGGKTEKEGALTVPARLINEYVNNLPTEKVTLEGTEGNTLKLDSENYHTNIKGLPAEDFPLIPQVTEEPFAKIDASEFKDALAETIWASSNNETQPEISGIFMAFEDEKIRIAATDRYRLAERTATLKTAARVVKEVIVPSRTVSELYKILSVGAGEVEIYFSESQVLFKFDDTELISRLIDGQYPDYRQIIPKEFKTEVEVEREEFIHALKAAALFVPDSNNITVEVKAAGITVSASSMAAGENTTQIKAKVSGSDNSAVFNFRYLLDCLNNLSEAIVKFKMINDASPASLAPLKRDNYVYIVMPIKL